MHQSIRIALLEEICTKVAEGSITPEIQEKAFNLQSKKKQGQIKLSPPTIKEKAPRKPRATK